MTRRCLMYLWNFDLILDSLRLNLIQKLLLLDTTNRCMACQPPRSGKTFPSAINFHNNDFFLRFPYFTRMTRVNLANSANLDSVTFTANCYLQSPIQAMDRRQFLGPKALPVLAAIQFLPLGSRRSDRAVGTAILGDLNENVQQSKKTVLEAVAQPTPWIGRVILLLIKIPFSVVFLYHICENKQKIYQLGICLMDSIYRGKLKNVLTIGGVKIRGNERTT